MMRLTVTFTAVLLIAASVPAFGAVLYGPLAFDSGDPGTQGGPYVPAGPQFGTTTISFAGDNLLLAPTAPGHGLVHDTGFTTKLSTYAVTSDGQWTDKLNGRYSLVGYAVPGLGAIGIGNDRDLRYSAILFDETDPLGKGGGRVEEWTSGEGINQPYFGAGDQASGDGVSDLDVTSLHNLVMKVIDTGDNATSTFKYTWTQEVGGVVNKWIVEEIFDDIRAYAVAEAQVFYDSDPLMYSGIVSHVEDLFDGLVTAARSSVGDTGFAYYVFHNNTDNCAWDNTTVTDGVSTVPGDTDGDGDVDDDDAATLAANWGDAVTAGDVTLGDFNNDGVVTAADASILAANWTGSLSEASPSTAVPEPLAGTLLLALLLIVGVLRPTRTTRA